MGLEVILFPYRMEFVLEGPLVFASLLLKEDIIPFPWIQPPENYKISTKANGETCC